MWDTGKLSRYICFLLFFASCLQGKTKSQGKPMRWVTKKEALQYLTEEMSDMETFKREILNPILIERIAGTPEIMKVREHIVSQLENLGWHVELDTFENDTPFGKKSFSNIIATFNPDAPKRTVIACHYDSKDFQTEQKMTFIAAVDSAVPCAIMVETAKQLDCLLRKGPKEDSAVSNMTLQLVFFDGEEAFQQWSPTDSIYGARHLAQTWEKDDKLSSVRELILLDLIGNTVTQFISHFDQTNSLYEQLVKTENYLRKNNMLLDEHKTKIFTTGRSMGGIEDDHIPFLRRGVDILHLISTPFPPVWHKETDDAAHLDYALIDNFSRIFRVFVSNLMHLVPEKIGCLVGTEMSTTAAAIPDVGPSNFARDTMAISSSASTAPVRLLSLFPLPVLLSQFSCL